MCEIFAGALTGGFTSRTETIVTSNAIVNCMLSVIVDPAAFDAPDKDKEAEAFVDWLKATRRAEGVDEVLLPGEREDATRRERTAKGIPVDTTSWTQIVDAARAAGMTDAAIEKYETH
jgi:uncharacterized oxidoreductase